MTLAFAAWGWSFAYFFLVPLRLTTLLMDRSKKILVVLLAIVLLSVSFISFELVVTDDSSTEGANYAISESDGIASATNMSSGKVLVSSTDAAIVLQMAQWSLPNGGTIHVGPGTYYLNESVDLGFGIELLGDGQGTVFRSHAQESFVMNDVSDVILGDLSLMGDGGIVIEGTGDATSHNIQVKNVSRHDSGTARKVLSRRSPSRAPSIMWRSMDA